jgi:hypothetical protein
MATTPWQVIVTLTGAGFMPGFLFKKTDKNQHLQKAQKPRAGAFCMIAAWVVVQIAVSSALHPPQAAAPMKPESLQLLVTRTMPFGKYQGRIIADLPGDYLAWFARKGSRRGTGRVAGVDA